MNPHTGGCRCGVSSKLPNFQSCSDAPEQRKSKCPCKTTKTRCNAACGCKNCCNPFGCKPVGEQQPPRKRKSRSPRKKSYKQRRTTTYLNEIGSDIPKGRWTDLETLTLIILSNSMLKTNLPFDVNYLCSFYDLFRSFLRNKQLLKDLLINAKELRQISAKFDHIKIHNY